MPRRLDVFNDAFQQSHLTVAWTLSAADKVVDQGEQKLELEAGDHRMLTVDLDMPVVDRRTPLAWNITIRSNDTQVFEHTYNYYVFPPIRVPAISARLGLYDPSGTTARALQRLGVKPTAIASLTSPLPELDVLIIGAGAFSHIDSPALSIGETPSGREVLTDFVSRGGGVLVLRQDAYPHGWFDIALADHQSTMVFSLCHDHWAFYGMEPSDLKFWRDDHMVSSRELVRPTKGGSVSIAVSGSKQGLHYSPLLERFIGEGTVVHCQLRLIEKAGKEPAADFLLGNLLRYVSKWGVRRAPYARQETAIVGGSDEYQRYLRSLGLRFDDMTERLESADLSSYRLVLCRGELPHAAKLKTFVEQGGNLVVHRPDRKEMESVREFFDSDLELQPYSGPVTRPHGSSYRNAREDLYWLGEHVGISWSPTPRATEMADGMLGKRIDDKISRQFEVEQWELEGHIVERRDASVTFATVGTASAGIDFPEAGNYIFGVVGRGSPCAGDWPMARVSVDDTSLGHRTAKWPEGGSIRQLAAH